MYTRLSVFENTACHDSLSCEPQSVWERKLIICLLISCLAAGSFRQHTWRCSRHRGPNLMAHRSRTARRLLTCKLLFFCFLDAIFSPKCSFSAAAFQGCGACAATKDWCSKLRSPLQYLRLMRQKKTTEKTRHHRFSLVGSGCAPDHLYQRSDTMWSVDQFAALFLTFGGGLETRWGECAVGSQGKYAWVAWSWTVEPLLVLVRRLHSCFIESCPQHLSSLTIWFCQGQLRDLNVPLIRCTSAAWLLHQPHHILVLWTAVMSCWESRSMSARPVLNFTILSINKESY